MTRHSQIIICVSTIVSKFETYQLFIGYNFEYVFQFSGNILSNVKTIIVV